MASLVALLALSAAMGLAIFLSFPLVLNRRLSSTTVAVFSAVAIGILVFLLVDIFSNVAVIVSSTAQPYLTLPVPDLVFAGSLGGAFLVLFVLERRTPHRQELSPYGTAFLIAAAIGFQNLTEGLLFGSQWVSGAFVGTLSVVFLGFFLQNISEGFPITSPLVGLQDPRFGRIVVFFLVGGLPTIFGSALGFFYHSSLLLLLFDGVAMGAILYAVLPMLRVAFRPAEPPASTYRKVDMLYLGMVAGFLLGFAVNAI
jgi:zinc transporter, ZIP family